MMVKLHGYIAYITARCATHVLRKLKAKAIAAFIFKDIICRWGNMDTISTDNGSEFDNEILTRLLEDYAIHHIKISLYNSRAQGIMLAGSWTLAYEISPSVVGRTDDDAPYSGLFSGQWT